MQNNQMQCNSMQYNQIQFNTVPYHAIQLNIIQCHVIQCKTMKYQEILGIEQKRNRVFAPEPKILFSSLGHPVIPAFWLKLTSGKQNFFLSAFFSSEIENNILNFTFANHSKNLFSLSDINVERTSSQAPRCAS